MIHDHVRTLVREPSGDIAVRSFQDRTLLEYRSKGFGLLLRELPQSLQRHQLRQPQTPATANASSYHPLIIETFDQLRALSTAAQSIAPSSSSAQQASSPLVFEVINRNTYNIPTYQTFVGTMHDPQEPFYAEDEKQVLRPGREYALPSISQTDRKTIDDWVKRPDTQALFPPTLLGAAGGAAAITTLRFDGVAISNDCAAVLTSAPILTEAAVVQTVGRAMLARHLSMHTAHARFGPLWREFFRPELPLKCYIGVGPSEFPETGSATTIKRQALSAEVLQAARGALLMTPPTAAQIGGEKPLWAAEEMNAVALAKSLGVTLLKRWNMRYYICR